MPMYASEILELVQTLLDRTLERCRAVYTEVKEYKTDTFNSRLKRRLRLFSI